MSRARALVLIAVFAAAACTEMEGHSPLQIEAQARVNGVLFNDLNGNAQFDAGDQRVSGWEVRLIGANQGVVSTATTDTAGVFSFEASTGRFTVDVDRRQIGDTLQVFGLAVGRDITLAQGDTVAVTVGLTYPKVSLAAVNALPVGRRVFVEGIALNPVFTTGPRELHLRSGNDALRITTILRVPVTQGDSVRVLATRALEARQPILSNGTIFVVRLVVADPEPLELTTRAASTAEQGAAGADLARVRNADLIRSRNELSDVILTVDDGTGQLEILLRSFLGADSSFFRPDSVRVQQATGLLVPYVADGGETRWRLATRTASDLRTQAEPRRTPAVVAGVRDGVATTPQSGR
jgi:hypothetical protein